MKQLKCRDTVFHILLFAAATLFIIVYAKSTGFLQPEFYDNDSTVFMYIGKAMKYGYVPYRDVYDIKGPMLWLIEYAGQLICDGRYGIHIIEIINFNVIIFLSYRTARLYLNEIKSFIAVFITMAFWAGTLDAGNAAEEFSYLWSAAAVYVTVKNIRVGGGFEKKTSFILYGAAAMCASLIRLTDCVIVGACIIYAGIASINHGGIKRLIINYVVTIGTSAAVLLPFIIYYSANGALGAWLDAAVIFSIKYAGFNKAAFSVKTGMILLFPIAAGIYGLVKGDRKLSALTLIMSVFCMVMYLVIGMAYSHYMIAAIPCVLLMCVCIFNKLTDMHIALSIALSIMFVGCNMRYVTWARLFLAENLRGVSTDKNIGFALKAGEIIGDNCRDSVYTDDVDRMIAFINSTFSKSRYFASQNQWRRNAEMKDKIFEDFVEGDNQWVITSEYNLKNGDLRITQLLVEHYKIVYSADGLCLFEKSE